MVGFVDDPQRCHAGRKSAQQRVRVGRRYKLVVRGGDNERGAVNILGQPPRLIGIFQQHPHRQEGGHAGGDGEDAVEGGDEDEPGEGCFGSQSDRDTAAETAANRHHVGMTCRDKRKQRPGIAAESRF